MITFATNGRPTSKRARRCSTRPSARAASARPSERLREGRLPADGLALRRRPRAAAWSAPSGCGTSRRAAASRHCCSGPLAVASGLPQPRHRRGAGAPGAAPMPGGWAIAPSCWSATRPITAASASRPRRPPSCGCPAVRRSIGCSALELSPGALDGARGAVAAADPQAGFGPGGGGSRHRSCPAPHKPAINDQSWTPR